MNEWKELIALRESKDLTQSELAKILHITKGAISQWENGTKRPTLDNLKELANYFEVTIEYLLGETPKDLFVITRSEYEALIKARDVINTIEKRNAQTINIENKGGNNKITINGNSHFKI